MLCDRRPFPDSDRGRRCTDDHGQALPPDPDRALAFGLINSLKFDRD